MQKCFFIRSAGQAGAAFLTANCAFQMLAEGPYGLRESAVKILLSSDAFLPFHTRLSRAVYHFHFSIIT